MAGVDSPQRSELLTKVLLITGLYISFVVSGVFEETLYKGDYYSDNDKKIKFSHPLLAIFLNSVISYFLAEAFLLTM